MEERVTQSTIEMTTAVLVCQNTQEDTVKCVSEKP